MKTAVTGAEKRCVRASMPNCLSGRLHRRDASSTSLIVFVGAFDMAVAVHELKSTLVDLAPGVDPQTPLAIQIWWIPRPR